MTTDHPGIVLVPSPDIVARDIAGEHLLVPVRSGVAEMDCMFTADGAGIFIWACLDGRRDLRAVAGMVAAEFDVDEERALADVMAFAAELTTAGLARAAAEKR